MFAEIGIRLITTNYQYLYQKEDSYLYEKLLQKFKIQSK